MFRGARIPLTATHVAKELQESAVHFYAESGQNLDEAAKAALKIPKQHVRRVLAKLELEGLAERRTGDGRRVRDLDSKAQKRLHHGKIRLYFFVRPRPADLAGLATDKKANGRMSSLPITDVVILQRLLKRFGVSLPREVASNGYLCTEIQAALNDYMNTERVAAEQLLKQFMASTHSQEFSVQPGGTAGGGAEEPAPNSQPSELDRTAGSETSPAGESVSTIPTSESAVISALLKVIEQRPSELKITKQDLASAGHSEPSAPAAKPLEEITEYASDRDELIAAIAKSVGQQPDRRLLRDIQERLELRGGSLRDYLDDIRPRLTRLSLRPSFGFFMYQARHWGSLDSAPAPEPQAKNQAKAMTERCSKCPGTGRRDSGEYCDCPLGTDLARAEKAMAKKTAAAASSAT
jgi:hypothetical protein